jgi:hypothetical protein
MADISNAKGCVPRLVAVTTTRTAEGSERTARVSARYRMLPTTCSGTGELGNAHNLLTKDAHLRDLNPSIASPDAQLIG